MFSRMSAYFAQRRYDRITSARYSDKGWSR